MDCCDEKNTKYDFDVVMIGSGSAAFAGSIKATELGKKVAIVEKGVLGGTCVNVGCVPSKTLIRAAETKHRIETSLFAGIEPSKATVNFSKLIEDKNALVEELRGAKYQSVLDGNENITLIQGEATFVDAHTIEVNGKKITSDKFLVCTGSKPFIPPVPGLSESGYLTSTTAFELKKLPENLAVLGGGYIALETAQMFHRLGSKVTIIQRSDILFQEDDDVSEEISKYLRAEGVEIFNHTNIKKASRENKKIMLSLNKNGERLNVEFDEIIVATGGVPNTNTLNLKSAGVEINKNGSIKVNSYCQTSQENIYAAGDVLSSPALVYVAAYEGNLAIENAFSDNVREADYNTVPWVIFSDPQISGVGLNEAQAKASGIEYDISKLSLDNVPRAIAAKDTRGFIKLLRKTGANQLIGARIVAPEGSELMMELSLMIKYKLPITEVASMMHPYLTLGEGVKLAAQTFDKDVSTLSCCAS